MSSRCSGALYCFLLSSFHRPRAPPPLRPPPLLFSPLLPIDPRSALSPTLREHRKPASVVTERGAARWSLKCRANLALLGINHFLVGGRAPGVFQRYFNCKQITGNETEPLPALPTVRLEPPFATCLEYIVRERLINLFAVSLLSGIHARRHRRITKFSEDYALRLRDSEALEIVFRI